jgi:hypothetical protein
MTTTEAELNGFEGSDLTKPMQRRLRRSKEVE